MKYTRKDFIINEEKNMRTLGDVFYAFIDNKKFLKNISNEKVFIEVVKPNNKVYYIEKLIISDENKKKYKDIYSKIKKLDLFFISEDNIEVFSNLNLKKPYLIHNYCFDNIKEALDYVNSDDVDNCIKKRELILMLNQVTKEDTLDKKMLILDTIRKKINEKLSNN